jgi:hypothetical protein
MMESGLDGNAAGGILQAIFPFDMTTAEGLCAGCGERRALGAAAVYGHGMGVILRCRSCDAVLIRVAEIKERYWLDMRGLRVLLLGGETRA